MNQWHPAPRAMIDDELTRRWTKDNPAPPLVVHMVLCSRIDAGHPWGKSKLARWAGLTDYAARQAIAAANRWMQGWLDPELQTSTPFNRHTSNPNAYQSRVISSTYTDESTANQPQIADFQPLARASFNSTPTPTPQEKTADPSPPDKPKKKKAKVIASQEALDLWADLVALRHQHRPGAAASLSMDPKMGRDLDDALTWASAPQILHAYDWWMRSVDCEWYQTRRVDIDTFSRPSKLGEFVRKASEWDHATEQAEIRRVELERESCPF